MKEAEYSEDILYSVPVGPKKPGQTRVYRNPKYKDALKTIPEHVTSAGCLWDEAVKAFGDKQMIEDVTYNQINQRMESLGSYLASRNHKVFFLYAKNCVHWSTADISCWAYGLINVPLYDTLGAEAFDHIVSIT